MVTRTVLIVASAGTMFLCVPSFAESPFGAPPGKGVSVAVDTAAAGETGPVRLAQGKKRAIYRPPLRGAPTRRVGGATRGDQEWDLVLSVLAPEQTGLTADPSPELYWYLSRPDDRPAVFALIRDDRVEPVVELDLGAPSAGGMGMVALADAGVRLEPGVVYEWSIALVTDPEARSKDVVSSATLTRRPLGETLRRDLDGADPLGQAALYAGAGYWYDAIAVLSADIGRGIDVAELRPVRADLCAQVGLEDAASFDRAH